MQMNEFKTQIYRLKKTYGAEMYPDESVKALRDLLIHIDATRFKKAIDRVLATYVNPKFAPGLDKIESALESVRVEAHEKQKTKRTHEQKVKKAKPVEVSKVIKRALKDLELEL